MAGPSLTSSFFFWTWLRLRSVSTSGDVVLVQALPALVELRIARQDPVWELAVRNGSGQQYVSRRTPTTEPVQEDRWYLVEFGARGLGSPAGQAWLWLDGVEVGSLSGLDWQDKAYQLEQLRVGEPWTDTGSFVGFIDVDDVRVSASPMASRLVTLRVEGTGGPGAPPDGEAAGPWTIGPRVLGGHGRLRDAPNAPGALGAMEATAPTSDDKAPLKGKPRWRQSARELV